MTLLYHLLWVTPPLTCPAPSPDQSGCQIGGKMHRQSRLQRRSHLGRTEGTGEISSGTPTCSETVVLSLLEWHQGLPLLAKHLTVQCVHTCVWCNSCSAGACACVCVVQQLFRRCMCMRVCGVTVVPQVLLTKALTATAFMSWSCPVNVCWHCPTRISHSWKREGGRLFTSPFSHPHHTPPHPSQHSYHTFHPPSTSLFAL